MKQTLLTILLVTFYGAICAQEGVAYSGLVQAREKAYSVSQKHGRNILYLDTETTIFYDKDGNIVEKYILQGNRTYKGKTLINRRKDPNTIEILHYNHMNLLAGRIVEFADTTKGEVTEIEYDAKGKILTKKTTRGYAKNSDLWEFHYNQVGYVESYFLISKDYSAKISEKRLFDFKDDLLETHYYSYDDAERLTRIIALCPGDSVAFQMLYKYDNGNLVEEQRLDNMDQVLESVNYIYDANNRLLQRSEFLWNPRFGRIPNLRRQLDYSYE